MTWSGVECSFDDSKSNQNKEKKGHSQGASTHKSPNLSIHHHFLRSRFTPNTVMKSLKNSNINPENLENLALIIPRDSGLAQSREIRDPVTRLESLPPAFARDFNLFLALKGYLCRISNVGISSPVKMVSLSPDNRSL